MNRFLLDSLETKQQQNCNTNVHIEDNENLCEAEQDADEYVEEESIYENNVYEQDVAKENVAEENFVDENIVEQNVTEENVIDESVTEVADGEVLGDTNFYKEDVNEKNGDYEQAGNKKLVENEHADENEHVDESDLDTERSSINDSDATPLQTTLVKK